MLVELGLVEQRYQAVREVLDGATVTDVARRNGVARQTVHDWLRRHADGGLAALVDRSSKPERCPHQMAPVVEARILELRRTHPAWGPARLVHALGAEGTEPLPGRSSVYRALVRHGLVEATRRARRREDYKRWERSRAMELWQMDIVGRITLADGTELSAVTGLDDHSRFCVCAALVVRAQAGPVCEALLAALERHGVPEAILTDNGKVFTSRFGPGPGPVRFDCICTDNGMPTCSPPPTHRPPPARSSASTRPSGPSGCGRTIGCTPPSPTPRPPSIAWVQHYNTERPHQSLGMAPPAERFGLAARPPVAQPVEDELAAAPTVSRPPGVSRWVDTRGGISLAGTRYRVGATFAGQAVEVVCRAGLVEVLHAGVVVATHAERRKAAGSTSKRSPTSTRATSPQRARAASSGPSVVRLADATGSVSFAGASYRVGRSWARSSIDVAIVAGSVQLSVDGKVIRVHPIRHDRAKEHGAFATPKGRPRKARSA